MKIDIINLENGKVVHNILFDDLQQAREWADSNHSIETLLVIEKLQTNYQKYMVIDENDFRLLMKYSKGFLNPKPLYKTK